MKVEAVHLGEPGAIGLVLEDADGITRHFCRRYQAKSAAARPPNLVITVFGDEDHVLASIEAGATGYVLKDSLPREFVHPIKQLRAGALQSAR